MTNLLEHRGCSSKLVIKPPVPLLELIEGSRDFSSPPARCEIGWTKRLAATDTQYSTLIRSRYAMASCISMRQSQQWHEGGHTVWLLYRQQRVIIVLTYLNVRVYMQCLHNRPWWGEMSLEVFCIDLVDLQTSCTYIFHEHVCRRACGPVACTHGGMWVHACLM